MKAEVYLNIKRRMIDAGFLHEIESIQECLRRRPTALNFMVEYIHVVCNSGMKAEVATIIYDRVLTAIFRGKSVVTAFGHKGKADAIECVRRNFVERHKEFMAITSDKEKLDFLQFRLPWIGKITKYHLARNLGVDCVKPDLHLVRIADKYNTTPALLCSRLFVATGDKVGVIDCVLWRGSKLGFIKGRPE